MISLHNYVSVLNSSFTLTRSSVQRIFVSEADEISSQGSQERNKSRWLRTLAANALSQFDVLGHDRHALGMDGAQICILQQSDNVCLRGFLQSTDCGRLKSKFRFDVAGDLSHQALEGKFANEKFS